MTSPAQITLLEHVNLRTAQLATMVAWYDSVLGITAGPRPDFGFDGAWLYVGDVAAVHLIAVNDPPGAGSEGPLKLEHFAFRASGDPEAFEQRLIATGERYRKSGIPSAQIVAFNLWDPDGNHIHVDFAAPA